jgi:hypothetical protein
LFGFKSASAAYTDQERALIEQAASMLGAGAPKWRRKDVEFIARSEKTAVSFEAIRRVLKNTPGADPVLCAIGLSPVLGLAPPIELLEDRGRVRPLLRPRLLHPRELKGPRRMMCRREVFGGLLQTIALGSRLDAPFVTTAALDKWGADFESVFADARRNYLAVVSNKNILEVQGAPGLLALLHEREQAAAAAFILDELFPPDLLPHGVVFATPGSEVMLAFPVIQDSGPDGLAAIVQASFSMSRERDDPLSERAFWRHEGNIIELPMTAVEDRKSRRIHIEARGPLEDLLRILGAIE